MGAVVSWKVKHSWYCSGLLNRSSRSAMRRFESCTFRQGNLLCHEAKRNCSSVTTAMSCFAGESSCGKWSLMNSRRSHIILSSSKPPQDRGSEVDCGIFRSGTPLLLWQCSSAAEHSAVNRNVTGSNPVIASIWSYGVLLLRIWQSGTDV